MSKSRLAAAVIVSALFLSACGSDSDDPGPEAGGPPTTETSTTTPTTPATPTEPEEPTTTPDGPVEPGDTTPPDPDEPDEPDTPEPDEPDTPVPAGAEELCTAFETAYDAALETGPPTGTDNRVDPALVEAFHQWGRDLEDVAVPDDFTDDQREGVTVMARVLQALPDDATNDDLEAIEDDLDSQEKKQTEAVSDYVDENCNLG